MTTNLTCLILFLTAAGDWPEPRQNPQLTAIQPLAGRMAAAPEVLARFDLGRSQAALTPVALPDGEQRALAIVAGALHCYDTSGAVRWNVHPPGRAQYAGTCIRRD
ncbi:MAG: hypothetical protein HYV26_02235 [Candidatus Hydrogenedentes bacterium]|nr:hypothetical protein [Candidatus Hydrogenedentota bacterium]